MAASTSHASTSHASSSFGSTSPTFRKRSRENDDEGPHLKVCRSSDRCFLAGYYYVLESDTDLPTDEDTESIHSVQDKPTDSAKDTSDLTFSEDSNIVYTIGANNPIFEEEYEPAPLSEKENSIPDVLSSASDGENISQEQFTREFFVIHDEDTWADSSSSSSECDPSVDPEISLRDYWSCVQCKATNNNPLFRYCERCFKIRKNFFPPRPKGKKKKKKKQRTKKRNSYKNNDSKSSLNSFEASGSDKQNCTNSTLSQVQGETPDRNFGSSSTSQSTSQNSVGTGSDMTPVDTSFRDSKITNSDSSNLEMTNNSRETTDASYNKETLCETCFSKPKDGLFVHGKKLGHMYCCYECSKKVWRKTGRCPLCNGKVNQVLKVIS